MIRKSVDGLGSPKATLQKNFHEFKGPQVDSVTIDPKASGSSGIPKPARWLIVTTGVIILAAFCGGAWATWSTRQTNATLKQSVGQISATNTGDPVPLDFDQSQLNIVANLLPALIEQNRHDPTPEELRDKLRKMSLITYLAEKKSPLAKDEAAVNALLSAKNMKMILGISFVESNMCKKQVAFNCSGIGGSSLRKYDGFAGWVKDFDNLLEKRYKNLTVDQFRGYYVQPGSQNWVDGVKQILAELKTNNLE